MQLCELHSKLLVDSDDHSLINAQWMNNNGAQMASYGPNFTPTHASIIT